MLGLVNGSFYAMLSLGLAVIFGLLGVVNFAHGAFYMLGAFAALLGLTVSASTTGSRWCSRRSWSALLGIVIERLLLRRLYGLDPLYGLLLTFGLALIVEGVARTMFGASGQSYPVPDALAGATNLGFMILPHLPRLGDRRLAGGLLRHLVRHRAHAPGRRPARRPPRTRSWCRPSASTCR